MMFLFVTGCGGSGGSSGGNSANANNAELTGMYVFALPGTIGSLQADGKGKISAGVEDNRSSFASLNGTYTTGSDGRGIINLNSSAGNQTLHVLMLSNKQGLLIRFNDGFAGPTLGTIDLQNPSAFSLSTLAANSYAFALSGVIPSGANGRNIDSVGAFAINSSGVITSGIQDFLPPQTLSLSGTLGIVDANGRGKAAFTTSQGTVNLIFYVVDSTHLKFFSTAGFAGGDAFSRQGPFSNISVPPRLALLGNDLGAILTTDGAGNVTSGTVDIFSGVLQNRPPPLVTRSVSGTYSMASNGRGTLSFADVAGSFPSSFVMYSSSAGLLLLDTTPSQALVRSGVFSNTSMALPQQSGSFSNASINGPYGEIEDGFLINFVEPLVFGNVSRLVADGKGNLSGMRDSQLQGDPGAGDRAITGTYSIRADGRGLATVDGETIIFYVVSGSRVLFISTLMGSGFWTQQQ